MKTYKFTLVLPGIDDEQAEMIYAKCDDASVGMTHGKAYAAFDRDAESLETAIRSAIADLQAVGVYPLRVEMDVPVAAS